MAGKTKNVPDVVEQSKEPVFRDGEEDLARIDRYTEYLKLQQRADGMTDEQYLKALDGIMQDGDEFNKGDVSYSESGPGAEIDEQPVNRVEIRDSLDAEEENEGKPPVQTGVNGGSVMLNAEDVQAVAEGEALEQGETELDGEIDQETDGVVISGSGGEEAEAARGAPGPALGAGEAGRETGPDVPDAEMATADAGEERDAEQSEVAAGADGDVQDEQSEETEGLDADAGGAETENGSGRAAEAGDAASNAERETEEEADRSVGVSAPEAEIPVSGPGVVVEDDDEYSQGQPGAGGTHEETMTIDGHVDVHKEQYQSVDFLDDMAVGTGLAASVETQEYIPPRDVTVEVPNAAPNGPTVPQYERSALAQHVIDLDERKQREAELDGPSGPGI